jgi:hypothetical protein
MIQYCDILISLGFHLMTALGIEWCFIYRDAGCVAPGAILRIRRQKSLCCSIFLNVVCIAAVARGFVRKTSTK